MTPHDDIAGGKQRCVHNHDPELPPPSRQHPLHAKVDLHHISTGDFYLCDIVDTKSMALSDV